MPHKSDGFWTMRGCTTLNTATEPQRSLTLEEGKSREGIAIISDNCISKTIFSLIVTSSAVEIVICNSAKTTRMSLGPAKIVVD